MDAQPKYKRILLKLSGEALSDAPRGILNFDKIEEIGKVIKECRQTEKQKSMYAVSWKRILNIRQKLYWKIKQ